MEPVWRRYEWERFKNAVVEKVKLKLSVKDEAQRREGRKEVVYPIPAPKAQDGETRQRLLPFSITHDLSSRSLRSRSA